MNNPINSPLSVPGQYTYLPKFVLEFSPDEKLGAVAQFKGNLVLVINLESGD